MFIYRNIEFIGNDQFDETLNKNVVPEAYNVQIFSVTRQFRTYNIAKCCEKSFPAYPRNMQFLFIY